jgi:hypothetical protein
MFSHDTPAVPARFHSAPKSASSLRCASAGLRVSEGRGATTHPVTAAPQAPTAAHGERQAARAALVCRTPGRHFPSQASSEAAAQQWPSPDPRRRRPWRRSSRAPATRPLAYSLAASGGRGQVAGGAPAYRSSSLMAQRHKALSGRAARRRSRARLPWDATLRQPPTARTAREWPPGRTGQ